MGISRQEHSILAVNNIIQYMSYKIPGCWASFGVAIMANGTVKGGAMDMKPRPVHEAPFNSKITQCRGRQRGHSSGVGGAETNFLPLSSKYSRRERLFSLSTSAISCGLNLIAPASKTVGFISPYRFQKSP